MNTFHVIQTRYDGCYFRSRLEARWAVFFNHLDIAYEYEPEGYTKDGIKYLPDFYLPQVHGYGVYVEIKPSAPSQEEKDKAQMLCEVTKKYVYVFSGPIPWRDQDYSDGAEVFIPTLSYGKYGVSWDNFQKWCECEVCGNIGIEFEGRSHRLLCHRDEFQDDKGRTPDSPRLLLAYQAARSARFDGRQES
jgi:hypothetical protein